MFVLRPEHLEAFAQSYRDAFEDRMVREVDQRFPSKFDEMGEEAVRAQIRAGVDRSLKYGISAPPHVARFIRFTFALGANFDTARRTAWARPILEDDSVPPGARLDKIREEARKRRTQKKFNLPVETNEESPGS